MYTRTFGKQKYTPPPGYMGTAFNDVESLKHHEPMETIQFQETKEEEADEALSAVPVAPVDTSSVKTESSLPVLQPIWQLLESLRGRFGTEEIILLLVIFLIASDGFSGELLILGILLAVH